MTVLHGLCSMNPAGHAAAHPCEKAAVGSSPLPDTFQCKHALVMSSSRLRLLARAHTLGVSTCCSPLLRLRLSAMQLRHLTAPSPVLPTKQEAAMGLANLRALQTNMPLAHHSHGCGSKMVQTRIITLVDLPA